MRNIYNCLIEADYSVKKEVLNVNFRGKTGKILNYIRFWFKLSKTKYSEYDIVYIHHFPYIIWGLIFTDFRKAHVWIHWHGSDISPDNFFKKIFNQISYLFIPANSTFFVPSVYYKNKINAVIKSKHKIVVSPSGGIADHFFIDKVVPFEKTLVFGFFSGISRAKGIFVIIQALDILQKKNKDVYKLLKLKIIKFGSDLELFMQQIAKHSSVIEFLEPITNDDMPGYYKQIDCLLFPTLRKSESLGLVAIEALATGTPVIGSRDFAITEYVKDNLNGYLFQTGDAQDLYSKMLKMFRSFRDIKNNSDIRNIRNIYSSKAIAESYKLLRTELERD